MPRSRVALANVDRPPDTSRLTVCDDAATSAAVETIRARLMRHRRSLLSREALAPGGIDRIVSSLRRLRNPHIGGYRADGCVLLSEPFNALRCAVERAPEHIAAKAVRVMFESRPPARVIRALGAFGERALSAAIEAGVRIAIVPSAQRFADYSRAVARLVPGIDDWSAPPAGLFVVEERQVLLRDRAMTMTVAHEFAHALDAVLARRPRSYFSYESDELRQCFANAPGFVNEYAASGLDEYFAESVRAYLEVNDSRCAWLPLTRYDLKMRDPRMFDLIERTLCERFEAV